jgi:hypothetical protein
MVSFRPVYIAADPGLTDTAEAPDYYEAPGLLAQHKRPGEGAQLPKTPWCMS